MPGKWVTKKGSTVTQMVSGRNNVFLVESCGISVLVDAGMAYMYDNLLAKLKKHNAHPSIIALTHTHYDHTENTIKLIKEFRAKVLVHKSEALTWLRELTLKMIHSPEPNTILRETTRQ